MLVIRREQMAVFSDARRQQFEGWMRDHAERFFPRECRKLGEALLGQTIRAGIERARAHGITSRRDVCRYIDLMLVLGREFDTDQGLPWAGRILGGSASAAARVQALHTAARYHLRHS
jgi:hypothetical protein